MELSKEFKKQLRLGLTAATGFVIAAAWKDSIVLLMNEFIKNTTQITNEFQITSISALSITIIGVFFIWVIAKVFK